MKKLLMLAGAAAAAFGVLKIVRGNKSDDEFAATPYREAPQL
jgi:hypothetical protein